MDRTIVQDPFLFVVQEDSLTVMQVDSQEKFLREYVGPVLAAHFRGHALAGNALYIDPVAAFITALLPVLREKVDAVVSQISHEPEYLSKFVAELLDFDEAVRNRFNYDGMASEGFLSFTFSLLFSLCQFGFEYTIHKDVENHFLR